jgi:hypothetical protein
MDKAEIYQPFVLDLSRYSKPTVATNSELDNTPFYSKEELDSRISKVLSKPLVKEVVKEVKPIVKVSAKDIYVVCGIRKGKCNEIIFKYNGDVHKYLDGIIYPEHNPTLSAAILGMINNIDFITIN